jgi:hypothetical protein
VGCELRSQDEVLAAPQEPQAHRTRSGMVLATPPKRSSTLGTPRVLHAVEGQVGRAVGAIGERVPPPRCEAACGATATQASLRTGITHLTRASHWRRWVHVRLTSSGGLLLLLVSIAQGQGWSRSFGLSR